MPGHMDPNTGLWVDDDAPEPASGGLAEQQQQAAEDAPPPPDYSTPPQDEPGDEPATPEPGALPPLPDEPAEDPAQIPVGGTTTPDDDIEAAIGGEGPPLDLTPAPEASNLPPAGPDDAIPPDATLVPGAPKPIVPATTQDELTQQKIDERQGKSVEDQGALEAKSQNAKEVLQLRQEAQKQRAEIIKKGEEDFAAARAKQNAEYEKYHQMGERDAWGDHSTAKKILAGIAIILGGRRAAALVIGAAQGFEEKKKEELALQKVAMEKAGHDVTDIEAHQKEQLANLSMQTAAGLDSTAARLDAELASRGVPADQRAANKDILAIKQAAFDKKRQAEIDAHKWASQQIKDDLAKNKADSEIKLNEAHAKLYDRMPVKKGGGGSGGGRDRSEDAAELAKRIRLGAEDGNGNRRELTPDEKMSAARELHIPINGKPSETTLDSVNKMSAFDANQARKTGGGEDKDVNKRMDVYEKQAVGNAKSPGPVRVLSQVEAMRKGLEDAAASGDSDRIKAAVTKAKEQAGVLMSGGKLTNAQIQILHGLESTGDEIVAKIGKFTGNPTEGRGLIKRLTNIIDDAGNETVEQIKDIRQRGINEHLGSGGLADTAEKKRTFMNRNNGLYSEVKWKGQSIFDEGKGSGGSQSAPEPVKPKGPPPLQYNPQSNSDRALATKARMTKPGDPNYASAQRWLSAHGLQ
jgi:hypothetical protein